MSQFIILAILLFGCLSATADVSVQKAIVTGIAADTATVKCTPAGRCPQPVRPCTKLCIIGSHCVDNICVPNDPPKPECSPKKSCPKGFMCDNGKCIDKCAVIRCMAGYSCYRGQCIKEDPCNLIDCMPGNYCKDGKCITDPCIWMKCSAGQTCIAGKCIIDKPINPPPTDPCENIACIGGNPCINGGCVVIPGGPV